VEEICSLGDDWGQDAVDGGEQFREGEGFAKEVPALIAELGEVVEADHAAGDEEDGEGAALGFEVAGEFHASGSGEIEVGDEEVDVGGGVEDVGGAFGVATGEDLVAFVLEEGAGEGADVRVIVDQQNGSWGLLERGCFGLIGR
jgi:hypothetical protein